MGVHACRSYAVMCIYDVCIVRFYVFIHVSMRMYVFIPILFVCLKQCIVCISETCRLILEVYLFVLVLFMDKHV